MTYEQVDLFLNAWIVVAISMITAMGFAMILFIGITTVYEYIKKQRKGSE